MSEKKNCFKEIFLPIIVLASICAIIAAAMAAINSITAPRIEADHSRQEQEALSIVVPSNQGFTQIEGLTLPESVLGVYSDNGSESYAVMLSVKGYDSSSPMSVAVGFDENGKIIKCSVISCSGETKGIGSKVSSEDFLSRFYGKNDVSDVDTITGATISSSAFKNAIKDACDLVESIRETGGEAK